MASSLQILDAHEAFISKEYNTTAIIDTQFKQSRKNGIFVNIKRYLVFPENEHFNNVNRKN